MFADQKFTNERKGEIVKILNERFQKNQHKIACPMCGHAQFTIADAYVRNDLQSDIKNVTLGGPSIPAVAIICNNCGFISQHAIGVLGLLATEGGK